MLIKLTYEVESCGKIEKIVNAPDNSSKGDIKKLFVKHIGIEYDENCYWEVLDN